MGQPGRALDVLEQALPICHEVGDRVGEATTLNNLGEVYRVTGQPKRALELYRDALSICREVKDRAGEATTLNNMALVHDTTGQPEQALELYQEALPIWRKVGDRAGEMTTLNNIGYIYFRRGEPERTVEMLRHVLQIDCDIGAVAAEAGHAFNLAVVLYSALGQTNEAIELVTRSISILKQHNLPQDANDASLAQHQEFLAQMRGAADPSVSSGGPSVMPTEQIQAIVSNTIAVMTTVQNERDEWRTAMTGALRQVQEQGADWQIEIEFFSGVLAILDSKAPHLPRDHPYAEAITTIQAGISEGYT